MNKKDIYNEIKGFCQANADDALVKKYSRYFKEGYDAYGLGKGLLEDKITEILERERPSMSDLIEVSKLLVPETKYELPSAAIWFFIKRKKDYSPESFQAVSEWFETGINNWAHTDAICMEVIKGHMMKQIITPADIAAWRFSDKRFKRRASLVSMICFMKNGLHPEEVFKFTEPLMTDKERVVQQGAGWLLKESWKKHPEKVEEFLILWKDQSPRLIIQIATEKINKEKKDLFRKSK